MFDIRDIMGMLSHRSPFLLVDKVVEYDKGKSLTAIKNVTYNEPFFQGHFPQIPTMPGVLILEALAQSCGLLTSCETGIRPESGVLFYFAGIDNARFKRVVQPGDQLRLRVQLDKIKRNLWRFNTRATVDGELACEADMMCVFKVPAPSSHSAEAGPAE
ncbi:MAG: 3-hydroxyacyl-ACP dehydratase FabZ [Nevskia sp.]|nr:3-hydroxyacyl-ACP dehydratase FabZ [Nevskia sp.]